MDILNIDPKVLILQIGGFVLLLIVFKLFLFKPILDMLDARRSDVESQYANAEAQRTAADELKAQYEKSIAGIEDEMRAKITEAVKDGQRMREEIVSDSRAQADSILAKAQEEIVRERDKAITELKSTVADLAIEAAGKLIETNLDDARNRAFIGKVIDDLGAVK